jgi:fumarylacetoacetase
MWVPIGYHGRSSSIVPSGTLVRRPFGQTREGEAPPHFGPSKRLDYEMELGAFLCADNEQGEAIPLAAAEEHLAGLCIVNDWSARDLQTWEYQPLGPFLAKNFATSISPWLVTTDALEPFRVAAFARADGDPQPLPYLFDEEDQRRGGFEITVEVLITTRAMREKKIAPQRLSRGNFRDMYWTFGQMITHHASNGCNLRAGDLLASGTISGTTKESRGSMLELSWRGTEPIELPDGETRRFLEEGDEITMRAWCEKDGFARIGFGECRGIIA